MALMRAKEIPSDAVSLSEVEAITYAWDIVTNWDSLSDTWALRYGSVFLGGVNAVSGLVINNHYRNKLKLGSFGFFSSVLPVTVTPTILTTLFHRHTVSTGMLLMRDVCPVCYEIRSSAIQLGMGLAYPLVLGPLAAMMLANRYATCRIPDLKDGPKTIIKFLGKITRPLKGTLAVLAVTQFVSSTAITYFEMRNHLTIRKKIIEIENKLLQDSQES